MVCYCHGENVYDFSSASGVTGVAKSLWILGTKEFFLFEKLFWFFSMLSLRELILILDSESIFVSMFSCSKHFLIYVLKLWEEFWIFAVDKTVRSLISLVRNVFYLWAS